MTIKVKSKEHFNFINGEWRASESNETIDIFDPANKDEVVGSVQSSTLHDLNKAVEAAEKAFPAWKELSYIERGEYLRKAADILENRVDEIAEIATKEMGKIIRETKGEVMRAVSILRYYSQEGMREVGDVLPSSQKNNMLFTKQVPLGVVGVISPWNFPIAIPIWKMAPALIYGNTVVLKPATATSITATKIIEVFEDVGFPKGALNLIHGKGSVIGKGLAEHSSVSAVTFTGSNEVGKQIASLAIGHGAKYQLEMGGKNPVIVMDDADIEHAAELTVMGAMKQTGQRCTATSRAYIHGDVYDKFKMLVVQKAISLKVGNGFDESADIGPLASEQQMKTVSTYIKEGVEGGAVLLCGGEVMTGKEYEKGFFVQPTVFENVTHEMTIAKEEVFGPVLCLIKVDSFEEALKLSNDTIYGLSASIFTKDISKAFSFVDQIEAGLVQINGETGGAEPQAPFGGMKQSSSQQREQGQAAKQFFTTTKTITITPFTH